MLGLTGTGIGRRVAIGKAMVLDRGYQEIPKYEVLKNQIQSEIRAIVDPNNTRGVLCRIHKLLVLLRAVELLLQL